MKARICISFAPTSFEIIGPVAMQFKVVWGTFELY